MTRSRSSGESKEVWTVAQSELASLDIGDAQFRAWRWHTAIGRSAMEMVSNLISLQAMSRLRIKRRQEHNNSSHAHLKSE